MCVLHLQLNKLQTKQRLPKWLQNPVYTFVKPAGFKKPLSPKKGGAGGGAQTSGLNLVHYGSSDDSDSEDEVVEIEKPPPSLQDIIGIEDDMEIGYEDEDETGVCDETDMVGSEWFNADLEEEETSTPPVYQETPVYQDTSALESTAVYDATTGQQVYDAVAGLNDAPLSFNTN